MENATGRSSGRPTWRNSLLRGLHTTATGNAPAFGFSITITVTFGIVSSLAGSGSVPQMFGFGLTAVAAFSVLNLVTSALARSRAEDSAEPRRVVLLATATDFLAVGAGTAAAAAVSWALIGWWAWLLSPFSACLLYIAMQSLELVLGERHTEDE